ncbi:MAG TPA: helix-turn-helix domain-containing protein [Chloroflexota bacterium]|nr:helix-turn-helix domain-containing protein [Chloroflexota bacterium]
MAVLNITDAAKVLGVSTQTIRRRIRAGTLQAVQMPGAHGATYRVMVPDDLPTIQAGVPDFAAAALARSLTDLRDARARITALESERAELETCLQLLQNAYVSLQAQVARLEREIKRK